MKIKIYGIRSLDNDKIIYIGSTYTELRYSLARIRKKLSNDYNLNYQNLYIELIREFIERVKDDELNNIKFEIMRDYLNNGFELLNKKTNNNNNEMKEYNKINKEINKRIKEEQPIKRRKKKEELRKQKQEEFKEFNENEINKRNNDLNKLIKLKNDYENNLIRNLDVDYHNLFISKDYEIIKRYALTEEQKERYNKIKEEIYKINDYIIKKCYYCYNTKIKRL